MSPRAVRKKSDAPLAEKTKSALPLRIVPLYPFERAAAAPAPQLTYRNGPLLTNVEVFTIFWGQSWQDAANSQLMQDLNNFFDYIVSSPLIEQLSEYNVPGMNIEHGTWTGSKNLTDSEPGKSVQDSGIQQILQSELAAGTLPASTPNSLYFVFLPPGTKVTQGGAASCKDFCGYHDAITSSIYYAVMPYPNCSGCQGGLDTLAALTSTSSHELCEAITDPVPGQGWYDDANGEIGDICAWKTKTVGAYTVQQEWSNNSQSCV